MPKLRIRKRKLVGAVMPYLAALAPPDWDVTLTDDEIEEPDYGARPDAVAITTRMVTSLRAYEIADKFRDRKVPVLMGGPHATFYSDEMANHADAVCVGEGEEVFPRMLEDAAAGRLQKFYRRDAAASLAGMPPESSFRSPRPRRGRPSLRRDRGRRRLLWSRPGLGNRSNRRLSVHSPTADRAQSR